MRAYLVNLDRRPDRLAHFRERADAIGLDWERVSAVNGDLPEMAARAARIPVTARGEVVGGRALGCTESHRKIWSNLLDTDARHCAALEDDIHMADDLGNILSDTAWIPEDADVVKLETMNYRSVLSRRVYGDASGRRVFRLHTHHLGTAGYVVSRKGAERLLAATTDDQITDTIDRMMFDMAAPLSRSLKIYQMSPAPCVQSVFIDETAPDWGKSDINTERYDPGGHLDANGFPMLRGIERVRYLGRRLRKAGHGKIVAAMTHGRYINVPFAKSVPTRAQ